MIARHRRVWRVCKIEDLPQCLCVMWGKGRTCRLIFFTAWKQRGGLETCLTFSLLEGKKKKSPKEPSLCLSNLLVFLMLYLLVLCCSQGSHSFSSGIEWEAYILIHFLGDGARKEKGPLISSLEKKDSWTDEFMMGVGMGEIDIGDGINIRWGWLGNVR